MNVYDVFEGVDRVSLILVGNALRGDDGVGPYINENLSELAGDRVQVIDAGSVPENYLGEIKSFGPELVVFIDAADFEGEVGEVRMIQVGEIGNFSLSTHGLSPKLLARYLEEEGMKVVFFGIRLGSVVMGEGINEKVVEGGQKLIAEIKTILSRPAHDR